MARSVKIGKVSELKPGNVKPVFVEDKTFALANVEGKFYAVDDSCTHVGGSLGEGELDGEQVICPWHGARFNVKTGEALGGPAGEDVRFYPVKEVGDELFIDLE